jgi:hypothetical protein
MSQEQDELARLLSKTDCLYDSVTERDLRVHRKFHTIVSEKAKKTTEKNQLLDDQDDRDVGIMQSIIHRYGSTNSIPSIGASTIVVKSCVLLDNVDPKSKCATDSCSCPMVPYYNNEDRKYSDPQLTQLGLSDQVTKDTVLVSVQSAMHHKDPNEDEDGEDDSIIYKSDLAEGKRYQALKGVHAEYINNELIMNKNRRRSTALYNPNGVDFF